MTTLTPTSRTITASDTFKLSRKRRRGSKTIFELAGTFASASILPGYLLADGATFVADGTAKTANGRFEIRVPRSGFPALQVSAATGGTSILVTVTDSRY